MNLEDLKLKLKFLEDGDRVYKLDTKINNFYVIKDNGWYGVGIDINLDKAEYFEKFENVRLITKIKYFSNENHKLLELITNKIELIEEFSLVCFNFISKFDDEKVCWYEFNDLEQIEHSYCVTIHKAQGSEFDVVIMVIPQAAPMLLTRNLLYTGITRAKKLLIVIGNDKVVDYMINNVDSKKRNTGLEYKLKNL